MDSLLRQRVVGGAGGRVDILKRQRVVDGVGILCTSVVATQGAAVIGTAGSGRGQGDKLLRQRVVGGAAEGPPDLI